MTPLKLGLTAIIGLAACVALSGCWTSDRLLLDAGSGVSVIPDGVYDGPDGAKVFARSTGHGWYVMGDEGAPTHKDDFPVLITPLRGAPRGVYAFAGGAHDCLDNTDRCHAFTYGLIRVTPRGVDEALPKCDSAEGRRLAVKNGGQVHGNESDIQCDFHDARSLRAALSAYARGGQGHFTQHFTRR